jgi:hypothetical protein
VNLAYLSVDDKRLNLQLSVNQGEEMLLNEKDHRLLDAIGEDKTRISQQVSY